MNGDGLVDLAVGSLGAAVLLWSVNPCLEIIYLSFLLFCWRNIYKHKEGDNPGSNAVE